MSIKKNSLIFKKLKGCENYHQINRHRQPRKHFETPSADNVIECL